MGIPAKNQGKFAIVNTLLNTTDSTVLEQLNGRQGDNGRVAYFAMKDGNLPHDISNQTVVITVKDAAGKIKRISGVTDVISATGGLFEMTIPSELYQAAGDTEEAYMSVEDNTGVVISSIPIQFNVLENNIIFTANGSKDYIDSVQEMIDKIEAMLKPLADKIGIEDKTLELLKKELADLEAKIDSKDVAMLHENNEFTKNNSFGPNGIHIKAGELDVVTFPFQVYGGADGVSHAPIRTYKKLITDDAMYGFGAGGLNIFGSGESAGSYTVRVQQGKIPEGLPASGNQEDTILASDQNVWIIPNMQNPDTGLTSNAPYFFNRDGVFGKRVDGKNKNLIDAKGNWVSSATLIAANTDLNNMRTPGVYDSGANANAATIKNGITNPSTEKGKSFILTVAVNSGGTIVQQDLKTYEGWAFTRTLYLAGSSPVVTPWIAYAGKMSTTVKGPAGSTIKLNRTANDVNTTISGMTGKVAGGATTTEKIPADYLPTSLVSSAGTSNMPDAIISSRYDDQVLILISTGQLKNFGAGEYTATGDGIWPVIRS
ncbi:BppU family phage baseplate upper protein [Weissella coleopterorum]|uniref:BppU family phage baseplate upper protein n=1 Tax=Weissella coleopterorum TaxID=2714949 RepID=A0A6G8AXR2_9LACO|nr:BppU family phage baseplate upper protein [Weissella coleopterorum]QIL49848.1 BppU family phage baseplate upper protein [Weissella coleopterorum]